MSHPFVFLFSLPSFILSGKHCFCLLHVIVTFEPFWLMFISLRKIFILKTQYKKCGHYNGCIITSSPAKLECHENNLLQIYNFQTFPVSWKLKFHSTECVHHNLEKCQSCKILTDNSHEYVNKYFAPHKIDVQVLLIGVSTCRWFELLMLVLCLRVYADDEDGFIVMPMSDSAGVMLLGSRK